MMGTCRAAIKGAEGKRLTIVSLRADIPPTGGKNSAVEREGVKTAKRC